MEIKKIHVNDIFQEPAVVDGKTIRELDTPDESQKFYEEEVVPIGYIHSMPTVYNNDGEEEQPYKTTDGNVRISCFKHMFTNQLPYDGQDAFDGYITTQICSDSITNTQKLVNQFKLNTSAKPCTDKQIINALRNIMNAEGIDFTGLAARVNKSENYLRRILKSTALPEAVRDQISKGQLSMEKGLTLVRVGKKTDPDELAEFIKANKDKSLPDFAMAVSEKEDDIKEATKAAEQDRDPNKIVLKSSLRKKDVVEAEMNSRKDEYEQTNNPSDLVYATALEWVLQLDPATYQRKEEERRVVRAKAAKAKADKKAEKENTNLADMIVKAASINISPEEFAAKVAEAKAKLLVIPPVE